MVRYLALKGLYDIERTIGCGGFAKVKLATHIATGEKVAIKIMEKAALGDDLPRVKLELKALQSLSHQHICKLYQVIETDTHFFLAVEYCSGGELFDHIVEKNRLTESESRMFFRQIVAAVAYLHSLGYIHRDLKPENVLLDHNQTLKLIDFGLCARPEGGVNSPLYTSCGSPTYAAPELVLGKQYLGPEVDIWALGVLLYALLAGFLPFDDQNIDCLYKKILSGKYEEPHWMSNGSKNLIRSMLQVDPKKRITMKQLLGHSWLTMGILDSVDCKSQSDHYRDDEVVEIMCKNKNISPDEIWKRLNKWKYDYETATYLLLLAKKKRGLPLKLTGVRNNVRNLLSGENINTDKQNVENLVQSTCRNAPHITLSPMPMKENVKTNNKNLKDSKSDDQISTNNKNNVLSPIENKNFIEPRRPSSIRKPQKRIRSPTLDGDYSPVPTKQKRTPNPSTPRTPSSECKTSHSEETPGSARKVLDSLERSLNKVRYVLTPRKKHSEVQKDLQPQTLTSKAMCNVSTTQCKDPEVLITNLSKALTKRGISCTRKGFTLRGKMEPVTSYRLGGCSFELEICYLPTLGSSSDIASIGIRRKRLKGDAWCYKKVCEQVLALTASDFEDAM